MCHVHFSTCHYHPSLTVPAKYQSKFKLIIKLGFTKNPQSLKLKNHDSLSSDETIETLSSKWKCCRSQEQSWHYPQDSHLRLHRPMSECTSYLKNVLATNVFGRKWKYSLRNYQLNTSENIPSGTQNFSKITLCSSNIRLLPSHDQNNSS